jgi:DNA-binding response OmpR family regulator
MVLDSGSRRNKFKDSPTADLILLDMRLPKLTGLEIFQRVPESAGLPICRLPEEKSRFWTRHIG